MTLSLHDVAGQERFDFFKTDFFKGCAAVGLVFDLTRPETFEKIDMYFKDVRERSGNVPIVLVGNKKDLTKDVGEMINRDKIIEKINQHNLLEYIETSALNNDKVVDLFNRLAIIALMDLRPRRGELINDDHFTFKVLLAGAAATGKSSLIRTFVKKRFEQDYKLTVGIDFMTRDFEIPSEELPEEVHKIIADGIATYNKKWRPSCVKEETKVELERIPEAVVSEEQEIPAIQIAQEMKDYEGPNRDELVRKLKDQAIILNHGRLLQILINNFSEKRFLEKLDKREGQEIQIDFPAYDLEVNSITFVLSKTPSDPFFKASDNPKATLIFNVSEEKVVPLLVDLVTTKYNKKGLIKIIFKYILTRKIKFKPKTAIGTLIATLRCFMIGNNDLVLKNPLKWGKKDNE